MPTVESIKNVNSGFESSCNISLPSRAQWDRYYEKFNALKLAVCEQLGVKDFENIAPEAELADHAERLLEDLTAWLQENLNVRHFSP